MNTNSLSDLSYHPLLKKAKTMQSKLEHQEKATSFLFFLFVVSISAVFIF